MQKWERDIEFFEASPWSQYAGSDPGYVKDARARGWKRIRQEAKDGNREAMGRLQCDGCRRALPAPNGIHSGPGIWDMIVCTAKDY